MAAITPEEARKLTKDELEVAQGFEQQINGRLGTTFDGGRVFFQFPRQSNPSSRVVKTLRERYHVAGWITEYLGAGEHSPPEMQFTPISYTTK